MTATVDQQAGGSGGNDGRERQMVWHAHSTPDPDGPAPGNDPVPEEVPQPDPVPVREPDPIPHQVPIRTMRRNCAIEAHVP